MTVAESIAGWLAEKGVRHAFGIVGGGNVALWSAIAKRAQTQIVCCHHEQAAVMAAAACCRVSGGIGVALVTTGGGSSNAITGVMAAWMDSVPVVILSGNESSEHLKWPSRVKGVQGFDSSGLAMGFTKDSWRLTPESWEGVLDHAVDVALAPRMGPVWVDIPKDVQVANA